jgi:dynein heavy chain 2
MQVLFGSGLLTPGIQQAATCLLAGTVPGEWTRRWQTGPEKPQAWMRELVRKRIALGKWKSLSAKGNLLGDPLSLGDFFNPATFINALRQQTARKLDCAIDRVKMICSWEKSARGLEKDCPLPCTLSRLLLQGAAFHGNLQESAPDANELAPAPNVTIGFVPLKAPDVYDSKEAIGIPVFLSSTREDFLMEVHMPIDPTPGKRDTSKWILGGVALFLTDDD